MSRHPKPPRWIPEPSNRAESSEPDCGPRQKESPAQVLIRQAVEHLMQQLKAGHSEALALYLRTMARFHRYSFGNILLIARQNPTATQVAGFNTWKSLRRFVRKGEKGIAILAPVTYRKAVRIDPASEAVEEDPKLPRLVVSFRLAYVFDIAQTEGEDLPELNHAVSGDVGSYRHRLFDYLSSIEIAVEFNESIRPALGVSYGGRIALLPGQSRAEEFATLVHETAHELLHKAKRRSSTTAAQRETEAEAVAYIVGHALGLDMGSASSDYIQLYNGDALLLAESLAIVQGASARILKALGSRDEVDETS